MGIEGNHQKLTQWELVAEHFRFNNSHNQNMSKVAFEEFYRKLKRAAELECKLAHLELKSWNNLSFHDAMLYTYSIVSTTGWGVFHPKSYLCKVITILYALCGIPLLMAHLAQIISLVNDKANQLKKEKWIRKYCGSYQIFSALLTQFVIACLFLDSWMIQCWIPFISQDITEKYEKANIAQHYSYVGALYYYFNCISLIGFGSHYSFTSNEDPFLKSLIVVVTFFFVIIWVALCQRAYQMGKRHLDRSMEKKMNKLYERVEGEDVPCELRDEAKEVCKTTKKFICKNSDSEKRSKSW